MTRQAYRMIGTTDDVVDCGRCGKPDLRMTVILTMLDADGNPEGDVLYFGSTCAARVLADRDIRVTAAKVRDQATAAQRERVRQAEYGQERLDLYGIPATGDTDPAVWSAAVQRFFENNVVSFRNNPGTRPGDSFAQCVASWRAAVAL